jgi:hypothetical protein
MPCVYVPCACVLLPRAPCFDSCSCGAVPLSRCTLSLSLYPPHRACTLLCPVQRLQPIGEKAAKLATPLKPMFARRGIARVLNDDVTTLARSASVKMGAYA